MRKSLLFLLLLAPAAAFAPTAALAQGHRVEITPTIAYRFVGDIDADDRNFLDEDLEVDEGEAYGLKVNIPLNDVLGIELLAARQETALSIDGGLFEDDSDFADFDIDYYHVGLTVEGGNGQIRPYFVGSLGLARLSLDLPNSKDEDRLSGSLGGGIKIFFSHNVGLRLEGRGYAIDLDEDDDEDDRFDDESSIVQGEASLGLIIAF